MYCCGGEEVCTERTSKKKQPVEGKVGVFCQADEEAGGWSAGMTQPLLSVSLVHQSAILSVDKSVHH